MVKEEERGKGERGRDGEKGKVEREERLTWK